MPFEATRLAFVGIMISVVGCCGFIIKEIHQMSIRKVVKMLWPGILGNYTLEIYYYIIYDIYLNIFIDFVLFMQIIKTDGI